MPSASRPKCHTLQIEARVTALVPDMAPRRFWLMLLAILAVGAIGRVLLIRDYLQNDPFATFLRVDALTYWNWAGRIAAGRLTDGQPFFSAPLYPYLLGLLRAGGGGLPLVYGMQAVLDLVTACLLALIGRRLSGGAVGLLAAAVYVLMLEPASFSLRVLTTTLQLLLVAGAWWLLLRAQDNWSLRRGLASGASVGLLALSYPPMLLALPVIGAWWWWNTRGARLAPVRALAVMLTGAVVILPATIHNYAVSGELFAIQAVSGLTLRQGNGPGATGVIVMIPGTSRDREELFRTAFWRYRATQDPAGTWRDVDRHYRREVLEHWAAEPVGMLRLMATKLYYFLTARNYSEIYMPVLERSTGLLRTLWLTPLQTAWLIPLALIAAIAWCRRPAVHFPALAILGLTLLVTMLFRYSPRYRAPAIPVIVVAAAWTMVQAARYRWGSAWTWSAAGAVVLAIALGVVNRIADFDSLARQRPLFVQSLGAAAIAEGDLERAVALFQEAVALQPYFEDGLLDLAEAERLRGDPESALEHALAALRENLQSARGHDTAGISLAMLGRPADAVEHFRAAVEMAPQDPAKRVNLANALSELGRRTEAIEHYRAALALDDASAAGHFNLGLALAREGRLGEAQVALQRAVELDPAHVPARRELAVTQARQGLYKGAAGEFRAAFKLAPGDVRLMNDFAWLLATCPDPTVRNSGEALVLAEKALQVAGQPLPPLLDTLAAALASAGRFAEATERARRAGDLAERAGMADLAAEIRARAAMYERGEAYLQSEPAR